MAWWGVQSPPSTLSFCGGGGQVVRGTITVVTTAFALLLDEGIDDDKDELISELALLDSELALLDSELLVLASELFAECELLATELLLKLLKPELKLLIADLLESELLTEDLLELELPIAELLEPELLMEDLLEPALLMEDLLELELPIAELLEPALLMEDLLDAELAGLTEELASTALDKVLAELDEVLILWPLQPDKTAMDCETKTTNKARRTPV